ncbi:MAG: hypothetical protein JSR80_05870, partial [Verrucomicrobia bacterium]|nr:hypothetical protein [Verrucomicrobiota bacterium]
MVTSGRMPRQIGIQAVDETRDMVALRAGRPFPAVWTGHCGGKTCPYQLMFRHSEG